MSGKINRRNRLRPVSRAGIPRLMRLPRETETITTMTKEITAEEVRAAQRNAPDAPETRELQRAYAQQRNEVRRREKAEEYLTQQEADREMERQLATVDYRETVEISAGPYSDFATEYNIYRALERTGQIEVHEALAVVEAGEHHHDLVGDTHTAEIVSARKGAHWSDQPHGRSGWFVIYTVRLPEMLRTRRIFDKI